MTTVRRVFLYLSSFIGMIVTLAGVFALIGLIVDVGFEAFRGFSIGSTSAALALIVAGGLAWRFYWRTVQREASATPEEEASGMRKLYLYGTMTLGLLGALILVQQVLSEFLVRLLDVGLNGYKPWTPLLIAAVLGAVWYWHRQIADKEQEGTRGADVRRGHWFLLAAYGIYGAATGLVTFISDLLFLLSGSGGSLVQALFPPLVQIVVLSFAIWMFWLPSQRAAASGDAVERASLTRLWLIHLLVFSAAFSALGGAQAILTDILNRLLLGFPQALLVLTINGPLASLIVGGLLLFYFFREVRPTLATARLSEYILAGVALFIGVVGVQMLIAALFQVLGGEGPPIESLIANVLPPLLVGGAMWRWRWVAIEAEAPGENGGAARSSLWRKVYLYFYQLVGLVMLLAGGVTILSGIIAAILGQAIPGNVLVVLSDPLAFLLVGSGLLIYMMQIVSSDGRLGALSVEEVMQHTLGDTAPTWAIAAVVGFVLGPVFLILALAALGPAIGNIFENIVRSLD